MEDRDLCAGPWDRAHHPGRYGIKEMPNQEMFRLPTWRKWYFPISLKDD